jgi:hypothetical protein
MVWEHPLKLIQQRLYMLDIGLMQINSLKLMEWCLGMLENWNGSEHLL